MKIEVNLMEVANEPDVARPLVVALLSALPKDVAELAVAEWAAVCRVRLNDADNLGEVVRQIYDYPPPLDDAARAAFAKTLHDDLEAQNAPDGICGVCGGPVQRRGILVVCEACQQRAQAELTETREETEKPSTRTYTEPPASTPTYTGPPVCGATTPIDTLHPHLSNKTIGSLTRFGFKTLGDLTLKTTEVLIDTVDRFGAKSAAELTAVMESAGLWGQTVSVASQEPGEPHQEPEAAVQYETAPWGAVEPVRAPQEPSQEPTVELKTPPNGSGYTVVELPELVHPSGILRMDEQGNVVEELDTTFDNMSIRDLMLHAEQHLGRDRVGKFLTEQGVDRLSQLGDKEKALRASVITALRASAVKALST